MEDVVSIPVIAVHPDKVVFFNERQRFAPPRGARREKIVMPISKDHKGKVSSQALRKISKAVDYLVFLSSDKKLPSTAHGKSLNFKISFVTLTLASSQIHSDNEIKSQCLNQFFVEAKKKWQVKNYIWRAEKQKNGNIHFHILTDKFIPWSELRTTWNRIQNKLGYVDRYREEMMAFHSGGFRIREKLLKKWAYKAQVKAYKAGVASDWHNPNSTDVHSIRLIANTKAYVMKYIAKDEQSGGLTGRMWGCNYELTDLPGGRAVVDSYIADELRKACRKFRPKFYKGEYFTVAYITPSQLEAAGAGEVLACFAEFLFDKFGYEWQCSLPSG
jgi:hypothetical protein